MKKETTKQRIVMESLKLFSKEGYEAVSVEQIAAAVGVKAPSLYKHFSSKRDIFDAILRTMEQRDSEQAAACDVPQQPLADDPAAYASASIQSLAAFSRRMLRYWTEDPFASAFRRMLTVEQYRSAEMNQLYHQYLCAGPLAYVADLLGSQQEALLFYAPMHLLYSLYDQSQDKESVFSLLDAHLERWLS